MIRNHLKCQISNQFSQNLCSLFQFVQVLTDKFKKLRSLLQQANIMGSWSFRHRKGCINSNSMQKMAKSSLRNRCLKMILQLKIISSMNAFWEIIISKSILVSNPFIYHSKQHRNGILSAWLTYIRKPKILSDFSMNILRSALIKQVKFFVSILSRMVSSSSLNVSSYFWIT